MVFQILFRPTSSKKKKYEVTCHRILKIQEILGFYCMLEFVILIQKILPTNHKQNWTKPKPLKYQELHNLKQHPWPWYSAFQLLHWRWKLSTKNYQIPANEVAGKHAVTIRWMIRFLKDKMMLTPDNRSLESEGFFAGTLSATGVFCRNWRTTFIFGWSTGTSGVVPNSSWTFRFCLNQNEIKCVDLFNYMSSEIA